MALSNGWQQGSLGDNLDRAGVDRREFMKFCGRMAAVFAAGAAAVTASGQPATATPTAEEIATALTSVTKPVVVWLQLQECTGCSESALRSGGTTIEEIVLSLLSVDYLELVMAASGEAANKALDEANKNPHILVVNGSIPLKDDGIYCVVGGKTAKDILEESAKHATAILAVGACATYGSVQAARPNPTGAVGVDEIITDKPVVNVPGCPPIGEIITASITYLLTHKGALPDLDGEGRPLFAYGQRIHDSCPRRAHFDAGQFVRTFDDEGARDGWCLYDVGCKGPSTFSPCPITKWNLGTSWPIGAGHPCIGCTEKHFFDKFTPFYNTLPDVKGLGIESTAGRVGLGLVGAVAAGVVVHGAITAGQQLAAQRKGPLQAFGDSERTWLPLPTLRSDGASPPEPPATPAPDTASTPDTPQEK
ncbi:MAG TPA: hydrogenase small subunit [Phycicoccus sp.]|nr:hydrogenase small subunit [Phycicoccus sp.]